ncbi:hypothetical protein F5877DRAFT_65043 [Lentinula edodes]|nr:hypothetical protein F5877DRAFT_65043 [Lentinula edodes]
MSMMWMRWNTGRIPMNYDPGYFWLLHMLRINVKTKRRNKTKCDDDHGLFDSTSLDVRALEIGAFLSIFMFGAVTMQGHVYYQNCKDDSKWFIFFVKLLIFPYYLNLVGLSLIFVNVVLQLKSHRLGFLNSAMQSQPLALFGGPLSQSLIWSSNQDAFLTTLAVKAYYIDRVRRLSSKWWLAIIGWLLTVINFGASLMVTYETFRDVPREPNNFELQREWGWLITLNLGLDALADVFIAAALVYQLRQLAMPFCKNVERVTTMDNRNRFIVQFHLMEFNYIWFAVYLPLATLYSNSLLASLNARTVRRRRLGLVQQQQSAPSSGNSYRSQVSLRSVKVSSSWASGTSGTRRSTIGSSCARVNPSVPASPNPRRSTVGSGSPVANSNKENITADNGNPRHRINSLLLDINGKRRMRESHTISGRIRELHLIDAPFNDDGPPPRGLFEREDILIFVASSIGPTATSIFHSLESASLNNIGWGSPTNDTPDNVYDYEIPPSLRKLCLWGCYKRDVMKCFLSQKALPIIRELDLGLISPSDTEAIGEYIGRLGKDLASLSLGFSSLDAGGDAATCQIPIFTSVGRKWTNSSTKE